ncbi:Protein kinase, putative [Hondaea fermentalgiana]|uniref:Protein kinase, putative n=1 Tax=Hondaea fermentalgiana TaxID=2315210 RepID=A0A2R5G363_9STRA|nr:Protein kinase, putative [Hondaea fermentalgiana]|eukprot:GBG24178.1 Protein kinase, putative [Hondaea fermentalgiana]
MRSIGDNEIGTAGYEHLARLLDKNFTLTSLSDTPDIPEPLTFEDLWSRKVGEEEDGEAIWEPLTRSERVQEIREYLLDEPGLRWTAAAHDLASEHAHIFAVFLSMLVTHDPDVALPLDDYELWLQHVERKEDDDAVPIIHALLDCRPGGTEFALPEDFLEHFITAKLRLKDGLALMASEDKSGRSARSLALANKKTKTWAKDYGTYLGRYEIAEGPPVHESKTCAVHFATDIRTNKPVAIKIMREKKQYDREIEARESKDGNQLQGCLTLLNREKKKDRKLLDKEMCLVMPRGTRSLFEAINTERFAGRDLDKIREISYQIASALQSLHTSGRIHGDIKPRNAVRTSASSANTFVEDSKKGRQMVSTAWRKSPTGEGLDRKEEWELIDLDASVVIGSEVSEKASTGYIPPEVARFMFDGDEAPNGDTSQDVWGFGVLLYQLLSGTKLFMVDESDDNLVHSRDKYELMNWLGLDEERIKRIKQRKGVKGCARRGSSPARGAENGLSGDESEIEAARDLVRVCLRGKATERLGLDEILGHPFFDKILESELDSSSETAEDSRQREQEDDKWYHNPSLMNDLLELPRYHFFLSHMQQQAAGIVKDLDAGLERNQMTAWVDMRALDITMGAMQRGVMSSQCFVMVLTTDVLFRPFCLAELKFAVDYFRSMESDLWKHIFFLAEEDERFSPWRAIEDEPWAPDTLEKEDEKSLKVQAKAEMDRATMLQDLANETDEEEFAKSCKKEARKARKKAKEFKRRLERRKLEEDLSSSLFDLSASAADGDDDISVHDSANNYKKYYETAQEALEKCYIIPYRRRHFEEEAMLRELAKLAGFKMRAPEKPRRVPELYVVGKFESNVVPILKRKLSSVSSMSMAEVVVIVLEPGCYRDVHDALGIESIDEDNELLKSKKFLAVESGWNYGGKEKEQFHVELQKKLFDHLEALSWHGSHEGGSSATSTGSVREEIPQRNYRKEHELEALILELQLRASRL